MKKLFTMFFAATMLVASVAVAADNYVVGGFEASGNVVAGVGWQKYSNNPTVLNTVDSNGVTTYEGVMGAYMSDTPGAKMSNFSFFVDGVELDLMKSFGENVRLRADLDFARTDSKGFTQPAFILEQAYATANIPVGNGLEFLLGRFNTPMGFESVDVVNNYTISKSALIRGMRPSISTGGKLYYEFSDLVDFHFYVINMLNGGHNADGETMVKRADVPAVGMRLGFNWGEGENESTLGISPMFGPQSPLSNKHYTFGGDVDLSWWATESFLVGAEALFTYNQAVKNTSNVVEGQKLYAIGGLLNLTYLFSDVWDGTLKYAFGYQSKPTTGTGAAIGQVIAGTYGDYLGIHGYVHEISLAGNYHIADGADLRMEGRFDIEKNKGAATPKVYDYGVAMAFAYEF